MVQVETGRRATDKSDAFFFRMLIALLCSFGAGSALVALMLL
ncbi:MAG TPA: hypothetical protein VGN97_22625 [Mesorhizobium sp.]|jgi:hypothetical protein|nr:hypothetical protein [Mesorhizobium sp.]